MPVINFDATTVTPTAPIEVIPADKYLVEITKTETKPTKAGNGYYLEVEFTVLKGEYAKRKIWDRLCLNHQTQKTVEIARANLSAICHAVGVLKPNDSRELHNIPLVINVSAKKDVEGVIRNEVKNYAKYESKVAAPPQNSAPTVTSANDTSAPWNGDGSIPF